MPISMQNKMKPVFVTNLPSSSHEANVLNDKTIQLQVLGQEAEPNRALYESLFSKLQSASLSGREHVRRVSIWWM